MENERWVRNTIVVYSEIIKKIDPSFKLSKGGATIRTITNFLKLLKDEYGGISAERIVDYCVCNLYAFRQRSTWNIKSILGPSGIERLNNNKRGNIYYENKWLNELSLDRSKLLALIENKQEHPQAKYIYMKSEESTKQRLLNSEMGFLVCQTSTLGWSPVSESCENCNFTQKCKTETQRKYPELYRIRQEYEPTED